MIYAWVTLNFWGKLIVKIIKAWVEVHVGAM